jgi:hypothetical protein
MSKQSQGGAGNAQHGGTSTTLGIGRRTSGEAGSSPTHETMAETGGSGGPGLTRNEGLSRQDQEARARQAAGETASPDTPAPADRASAGAPREDAARSGSGDSGARGFQDTRSQQAGAGSTGLGTPETGANQDAADLERHPKDTRG